MADLRGYGFRRGWIYEAIAITGGERHQAPMGVSTPDYRRIMLEVYRTAETCENLMDDERLVIVFPRNVSDFERALSGRRPGRLKDFLKLRVASRKRLKEKVRFECEVKESHLHEGLRLINRAESLVLESLIEATKPRPRRQLIVENLRLVKRVAKDSEHQRLLERLLNRR